MSGAKQGLNRRDFLKFAATALGGAALACGKGAQLLQMTATPIAVTPSAATHIPPIPTLAEAPDTILIQGKVLTVDRANTIHQAIAIRKGLIQAVGTDADMHALAGPNTQVIELKGRTVTPGLIDAHNHMYAIGLYGTAFIDITPPGVRTIEELQAKIAEGVARTPPGKWVVAMGFITLEGRYPDRHDLDPVSPDHPVMLTNMGGHVGVANTVALKLAGVTSERPDPPFGKFLRDPQGEPTGVLVNHAALDVVRRLWVPEIMTPEIHYQSIIKPQHQLLSYGLTSIQDVNVRGVERLQTYFDVARKGQMSLRAFLMNTIEYYQELEGRAEVVEAMRFENELIRYGGFKFLVDGAAIAAFTHEPHRGVAWNIATWKPEQLNEAVSTLHAAGYQTAFHVIGDAAVDMALDAIETAMNKNPRPDPRHRLEHAILNTPSALERTRDLGVIVSTQPQAIRLLGDVFTEKMGKERAQSMMPTRTWLDMGVPLALGSDAPTMPWYFPQACLAMAQSRTTLSNQVIGPEQRMTFEEALRGHTMGGAYAAFKEKEKGSLEPGKVADLVVWTDDPASMSPEELWRATVDLTMLSGQVVYQKP